jgi:tol-pal system protein YbgF
VAGCLAAVGAISFPAGLSAQENLGAQVERLQRELTILQRQVYRGEVPPAAEGSVADGDVSGTQAARIELRLSQFESELRAMTGQIEQFGYKINQVDKRLDSLVTDVDRRLQNLEQRLESGAAMPGESGAGSPGAAGTAANAPAAETALQPGTTGQASTSGTLGVIDQQDLKQFQNQTTGSVDTQLQPGTAQAGGAGQTAAATGAVLPAGTPQEQYNYAFSLLRQAQYGEAEQALQEFVAQNPDDALAGNAKYWLGETFYVRGDYQQSAVIFAEAYQQYPNNSKAPDNLLKLGMSLGALGNNGDACGTFAELLKRYPQAAATVLRRTQQEQQRYGCQ